MSSVPPPSSSARAILLTGFLAGASAAILINRVLQSRNQKQQSLPNEKDDHEASRTRTLTAFAPPASSAKKKNDGGRRRLPDHIRQEQLSRHELYFGQEGMRQIRSSRVVVVGLGGVGSHAAIMLARGGVERLTLIDFDLVTVSSLNRHACATLGDVGTPKVECVQRTIEAIAGPGTVNAMCHVEMLTAESAPRLIPPPPSSDTENRSESTNGHSTTTTTIVVDAIDDVPTKAALIAHCLSLPNVRVVSCMGAGGKADLTRLHVSDLRTASRDPLASKLRQTLKKMRKASNPTNDNDTDEAYLDDMSRLTVLYSSEKTVVKLADFTDEQRREGVHQFGAVDGMRIRIVPVLGTMPAIMGQSLAAIVLTELGHKPFQPVTGERVGRSTRHSTLQRLSSREKRIEKHVLADAGLGALQDPAGCDVNGTWVGPIFVDDDDVEYLLEVWRNRCGISNARLGASLELVRWDLSKPAACDNLVLMSAATIKRYDRDGKGWISEEVQQRVVERLATCRVDR